MTGRVNVVGSWGSHPVSRHRDGAALLSKKGPVEPDKPILNELTYLRVTKRAHRLMFIGRHAYPHIAKRATIALRRKVGAAHLVQEHVTALQLPEHALVFHRPKQATPSAAQEEDQRAILRARIIVMMGKYFWGINAPRKVGLGSKAVRLRTSKCFPVCADPHKPPG
jgi:hypothetical protein